MNAIVVFLGGLCQYGVGMFLARFDLKARYGNPVL